MSIEVAQEPYTDGFRIHVPATLPGPNAKEKYRVFTALNVGYIEFGTLDVDLTRVDGDWVHPSPQELEIERECFAFFKPGFGQINYSFSLKIIESDFMFRENIRESHMLSPLIYMMSLSKREIILQSMFYRHAPCMGLGWYYAQNRPKFIQSLPLSP